MPFRIDEDVLGLHVTIGHALVVVQEFQNENDLGGVETCGSLVETVGSSQIGEHLPAGAVIQLTSRSAGSTQEAQKVANQHVQGISV